MVHRVHRVVDRGGWQQKLAEQPACHNTCPVAEGLLTDAAAWRAASVAPRGGCCLAGYALAVFIPVSFVCVFPVEKMRWAVLAAATGTSALFLLLSFRKPIHDSAGAKAMPLLLIILALHLGLGLALKFYFFHYSSIAA